MATRGYDGPSGLGPPDGSGAFQNLREFDSFPAKAAEHPWGLRLARVEEERP